MTVDAARESLFGESIAHDDARPLALLDAMPGERRRAPIARAEALMRALALVEDARPEEADEHGPNELAVRRLEAKVDLLVNLVGALLHRDQPVDPVRSLRWSARGAVIDLPTTVDLPAPGRDTVLRLQPSDTLPETLLLPANVLAVETTAEQHRLWLRFDGLPPSLETLLERHLFRLHRRAIAESRRQR